MKIFAQKKAQQEQSSTNLTRSNMVLPAGSHAREIPHLHRTNRNQAALRLPGAEAQSVISRPAATTHLAHDFSRIPLYAPAPITLQPKLTVNTPGDAYEQEADHFAEQVMRMSGPNIEGGCACGGGCSCQSGNGEKGNLSLQTKHVGSNDAGQIAAPPIVHEVLASPGQALDSSTRAFFEPRFGHDFSRVRVHTDAAAEQSTRDVNAFAYTVGHDIVFGAGEFLPGTLVGRLLLAHELTHVVQQERSPVPVAMQLQPAPGRSPSPTQPTTAPPSTLQPLEYDRTAHYAQPVNRAQTVANVRNLLAVKVKNNDITSYALKGAISGNEELFLLSLLYGLAQRTRWGTEADIVTAINWPAKPGDTPPKGRVTVRIDHRGAASVELIARGLGPPVSQQTTVGALEANFKLASVTDDTAKWTPAELNDVGAALAMLPTDDKGVLEGVELIRVDVLKDKPADGASFSFQESAATDATQVNIRPKLRISNLAFLINEVQFFGGTARTVPASFQAILHEVGHAIESEVYRSKWKAHAQALADTRAAGNAVESDKQKAERIALEDQIKKTENKAAKKRLEQKLTNIELDLARRSEKAVDQKASETKLKEKEAEVLRMDAAGQTLRLTKFLDLVKNIKPFTSYSARGPREFYAEAYSLWLVDPEFLKNNYEVVYKFFESGDYRR